MRFPDWPERLAAFIESRRETPFEYGTNDCCLFAADAVLALTGVDFAAEYRGKYSTKLGAARLLTKVGGTLGIADEKLEPLPLALAGRGDIVLVPTDEGDALAVCVGPSAAAPTERGLTFVPRTVFKRAWKGDACLR